jgi:superfamily I DNA/RNA helicase
VTYEPTLEQQALLDEAGSVLVIAGPGTGKTRTAIEKARLFLAQPNCDARTEALFLSFSNAAIDRLAREADVRFSRGERQRLRFVTYHSCAAELLRLYGRFAGLPVALRVMDQLEERLVLLEHGWSPDDEDHDARLVEFARRQGLLSFDVLIPIVTALLRSCPRLRSVLARQYPLIVVDEFQDTNGEQWDFLRALGGESQVVAFGDPNQIIYASLWAATARRMDEFQEWKGVKPIRFSARNFRTNSGRILEFAESLLTGTHFTPRDGDPVHIVDIGYRKKLRFALAQVWLQIRRVESRRVSVGFLAPSRAISEEIAVALRDPPPGVQMPVRIHARLSRDEAAQDAVTLALAAARDFAVRRDDASRQRLAMALVAMNSMWSRNRSTMAKVNAINRQLATQAASSGSALGRSLAAIASARDLGPFADPLLAALGGLKEFGAAYRSITARGGVICDRLVATDDELPLFDQARTARAPKGLSGDHEITGNTHVLNYHKAKGREFDYVVMVVDPRGESTRAALDEQQRLYYVCATRPRHWLGVLHYGSDRGRVLGLALGGP